MTAPPSTAFLICSTPRSGTTLLCQALTGTGLAGRPEEYFQALTETGRPRTASDYFSTVGDSELHEVVSECAAPAELDPLVEPSRFPSWGGYFRWVLRYGTTPNGVFGAKIMWAYLDGLVERLSRELAPCSGAGNSAAALECAFSNLRYVFVTREDKVGQAVSLWRALQTWRWRDEPGSADLEAESRNGNRRERRRERRLHYSFEAIDYLVRLLTDEETAWCDWFEGHDIEPLTVVYEDFAAGCEEAIRAILRHIGVQLRPGLQVAKPELRRQADGLSKQWIRRYASEVEARVRL
jgi:trehalose 2-sulfotransferase